jgi:hypothetical protein
MIIILSVGYVYFIFLEMSHNVFCSICVALFSFHLKDSIFFFILRILQENQYMFNINIHKYLIHKPTT